VVLVEPSEIFYGLFRLCSWAEIASDMPAQS